MDEDIFCHFNFESKKIKSDFMFKTSNTVREIIEKFLRETNSKMDYSPQSISFRYFAKILNRDTFLDKPLSKVLKAMDLQQKNFKITIFETQDIIGGFIIDII